MHRATLVTIVAPYLINVVSIPMKFATKRTMGVTLQIMPAPIRSYVVTNTMKFPT